MFTDGACSGNPGPGGWAWVTEDGRSDAGGDPATTNQRMELTAVARAIDALEGPLDVFSDSTYVVNCFNDRWYDGWIARGWRNSQKKPVANRDLWEPLIAAYIARAESITFTWVKGHAGNELNEIADQLAVAEVQRLKERLPGLAGGSRGVDDHGSAGGGGAGAEPTASGAGPVPPWPIERGVVVTGARELDGELADALGAAVANLDRSDVVVSGLRLGAELDGAEQALLLGVPLGVVLPYPDPVRVWSDDDRARFDSALEGAAWVVTLDGDPAAPPKAIAARNRWLWAAAVGAIVVADPALVAEAELAGLGVVVVGDDG